MTEIYKLARPLLTGVKIELIAGRPLLTTGEPVPNRMITEILGGLPNFTGEIVVGKPHEDCYERSWDFVSAPNAINLFVFWVYDAKLNNPMNLRERLNIAESMIEACGVNTQWCEHELIETQKALEQYHEKVCKENYFPGIVLREPFGTYGTEDQVVKSADSLALN